MNPSSVLRRLYGLERILRIHRPDNDAVTRVLDALETDIEAFHAEHGPILIQVLTGELFVNRQLVRPDDTTRPLFEELGHVLTNLGVEAIAFLPGVSRHALESLAHQVASGGVEPSSVGHIRVAPTTARSRFRELLSLEEQARQVHATLVSAVEELGTTPGEVPLRTLCRALLLTAETVEQAPGAFRGLRVQGRVGPRTQLASGRAVHALQLAAALRMSPSDRLVVGLSAVLGAMVPSGHGASWLLRFGGLGALAPRVVLAVHESTTASSPEEAGVLAQVLALASGNDAIVDPEMVREWAPTQVMAA